MRGVLGDELSLGMRANYGRVLCQDYGATLDDLREAVNTLDDARRTARRFLGDAHPHAQMLEELLRHARAVLAFRETPSPDAA